MVPVVDICERRSEVVKGKIHVPGLVRCYTIERPKTDREME